MGDRWGRSNQATLYSYVKISMNDFKKKNILKKENTLTRP